MLAPGADLRAHLGGCQPQNAGGRAPGGNVSNENSCALSVLQVLVCILIGAGASVLKTLAAKLLATSFHRQAHFDKMQDALSKVIFLKDYEIDGMIGTCARVPAAGGVLPPAGALRQNAGRPQHGGVSGFTQFVALLPFACLRMVAKLLATSSPSGAFRQDAGRARQGVEHGLT